MWKLLQGINRKLIYAIPMVMAGGFLFGLSTNASFLKSLIMPLTFLMVYPMMTTLKIRKVLEGGDLKAQFLAQIINFGFFPFMAFSLGLLFFKDQPFMSLGLVLAGLIPTSGMTISWTGFAGGNKEAAVKMTVIGLGLGALLTPAYVEFLMGEALDVDFRAVSGQILLVVFLPMLAGYLTQTALIRKYGQKAFQEVLAPRFPVLASLGVLAVVFIAMALKAKAIYAEPGLLLSIFIPLAVFYVSGYLVSALIGKALLPKKDAIALVYGTVMRNLSIALAVAMNAFGEAGSSAALVVAIAYVIQVQSAAWTIKGVDRFFKEDIKPASELEAA